VHCRFICEIPESSLITRQYYSKQATGLLSSSRGVAAVAVHNFQQKVGVGFRVFVINRNI
jgi:hypothetical protein